MLSLLRPSMQLENLIKRVTVDFILVCITLVGIMGFGPRLAAQDLNWVPRSPTNAPSPRNFTTMVYDAGRGHILLFGGANSNDSSSNFTDTWIWDGANWGQTTPGTHPSGRYFPPAMAYDAAHGEVVMFGGTSDQGLFVNETWVWDGVNWTLKNPATPPPHRSGAAMVYDAARGEIVMFGGSGFGAYLNDTWVWDGQNWTQKTPAHSPPLSGYHAMAYDAARGQVVMFGGNPDNQTWIWDGSDWTAKDPANSPPARLYHTMAYDSTRGQVVLFGGFAGFSTGEYLNDTWTWDGTNWTAGPSNASLQGRYGQAMAYDSSHGQMVLFGGANSLGIPLNDTWVRGAGVAGCIPGAVGPSPADCETALLEDAHTPSPIGKRIPLLLIHGIHGNRASGDDTIFSPNLAYFDDLIQDLTSNAAVMQNYKIYLFNYVSDQHSVSEIGQSLRNWLDYFRKTDGNFDKQIVIIAHSMGGLVARSYMNEHHNNYGNWSGQKGGEDVLRLITLATPHDGTPVANGSIRLRGNLDPLWSVTLSDADFVAWGLENGCYACAINPIYPNRSDLRYDNVAPVIFPAELENSTENNAWLATLLPHTYDSKIKAYFGTIGSNAEIFDVGSACADFFSLDVLKGAYSSSDYEKLGVLLERIFSNRFSCSDIVTTVNNDGVVPFQSGMFSSSPQSIARVWCSKSNHDNMKDGKGGPCNDVTSGTPGPPADLFSFLRSDLNAAVGSVSPAEASIFPSTEAFGNQGTNTTSIARKLTLTSTGTDTLTVSSITIAGANASDFHQSNNCPASLAFSAKCTISLTYTPSILGLETTTLTITDNAGNSPQTVALTGTGVLPATLSSTSLSFGNVGKNSPSALKNIALTNNLSVLLTVTSIATGNQDYTETDNCTPSVAAKASCVIHLTLTPSVLGADNGTLAVNDSASNAPQTAALTGSGIVPAALSTTTLAFGSVGENSPSVVKNIALTNNLAVALTVTSITTGNPDYTETDNCTPSVAAKASCVIHLTLTPTVLGADNGTLTVNDSASNTPQTVALTGTGIVPVMLSAATLAFGSVGEGSPSAVKNIALTNNQAIPLTVSTITTGNADYTETDNCKPSVAAKANCTIHVTLTPTALGSDGGTLTVIDSASDTPQTAMLTGSGIVPATLSATSIAFGSVGEGSPSAVKNIALTNHEAVALSFSGVTFTGTNAGDFSQTNTCTASLSPAASCTIRVTYTPATLGAESATLNVNDGASNTPQTATLTGTGILPVTLSAALLNFGTVLHGTTSAGKNLGLTNAEAVVLPLTSFTITGANAGDFAEATTCGASIAAKASCTITIKFTPSTTGAESATVTVTDGAITSPQTVTLTGAGK